ncbi:hypothetical protein HOK51_09130 [Candidatus Woesearchaeota archaeon]|jgi:hypothetical protein|nr:hypothetical protein [Candidatus Woesearchaeota archaeon]MBT6519992.1 hypothetical protein [Candidatus Woesearchaeota archaeon]MBT7367807.1 hypothetical protein [Candidatus Woesearchaeota archaeon]
MFKKKAKKQEKSSKSKISSRNNIMGKKFEIYVANLYKDLGKRKIRHDTYVKIPNNNGKSMHVQIDVMYKAIFYDHYIECKYRKPGNKVSLDEVAKFYAAIELIKVPMRRAELITNQYFNDRAIEYADTKGLKLYNLDDLLKMEKERRSFLDLIRGKKPSIERIIWRTDIKKKYKF